MKTYLTHLRLPFQVLLSPIFLMGFLLAGGRLGPSFWIGYLSFHLFLYAGGTALNSAYDRDEGPVGGLERPPPPPPHLFLFSLIWQAIGFALAVAVSPIAALIYFTMFWMSIAYSHPRLRFKGKPLPALATIALGQGILPFLAAWAFAGTQMGLAFSPVGLLGMGATTLITAGLYPLTAIYQLEEDARRGDLTLAAWLGPVGSFLFAKVLILVGGVSGLILALTRFSLLEALGLAIAITALEVYIFRWQSRFKAADILGNFRSIMGLYTFSTLCFLVWLGARLVFQSLGFGLAQLPLPIRV